MILNLRDLGDVVRRLYEGKGSQKRILILLMEEPDMTQAELTRKLGIRQGSASEVIRKLDTAGLICRRQNDTDKRTVDICLTEEGRKAARQAAASRKQRHKDMFSCLTEEEQGELLRLLEKLNQDWRKRYGSGGQEEN